MSDTKPLTERLRTDAIFDNTTLGNEAADALEAQALQLDVQAGSIEAVQAANQRLAAEVAEHKENAIRNARIAVSIRAERDQLQAENERLELALEKACRKSEELQSRLDAMGKGQPIYQYQMGDGSWIDQTKHSYDYNRNHAPNAVVRIVYAAPKALAPEKVEAAWRAGWAACRDSEYVGQEAENEAWGMSQTCANADWENAAPKALAPEKGTELFDAWCDKSYADGMLLGWNLCESNHPETFQQLRSTRTEAALKVILANRAAHGIGGTP